MLGFRAWLIEKNDVVPMPGAAEAPRKMVPDDVNYKWAMLYVAPNSAKIQYMKDRVRFHLRGGRKHDVMGGHERMDWAAELSGGKRSSDPDSEREKYHRASEIQSRRSKFRVVEWLNEGTDGKSFLYHTSVNDHTTHGRDGEVRYRNNNGKPVWFHHDRNHAVAAHQDAENEGFEGRTSKFEPRHRLKLAKERDVHRALAELHGGRPESYANKPVWHHLDPDSETPDAKHSKGLVAHLKAKGYHGVVHRDNITHYGDEVSTESTAIFEPNKHLKHVKTVRDSRRI